MRALLVSCALALIAAPAAFAAPCPGAAQCPYSSVTQIAAPPAADEIRDAMVMAVAPGGGVWVADGATLRVFRLSASGAVQGSFGGPAVLKRVSGLAVSQVSGDVYVAEGNQGRLLRFSSSGQLLGEVGAGAGLGQVTSPVGVAVRPGVGGRVYVSEGGPTRHLQSFTPALGSPADESEADGFSNGAQLAFDAAGANLWALHPAGVGLSKFAFANLITPLFTVCPNGSAVGECLFGGTVNGLTVDADGRAWVPDRFNDRIQRFDADGGGAVAYGAPGPGDLGFISPQAVAADGASLVVTDASGRLRRYDRTTLALQSTVGGRGLGGLLAPQLAIAPDGSILQQDEGASLVRQVGLDGLAVRCAFGVLGLSAGQLYYVRGIAADEAGNVIQVDQLG